LARAWAGVRAELTALGMGPGSALVRELPTAEGLALDLAARMEMESAAPKVLGTEQGSAKRLGLAWAVGLVAGLVPAWARV